MAHKFRSYLAEAKLEEILFTARIALVAILLLVVPLLIYLDNTTYGFTKIIFTLIFASFILLIWVGEMLIKGEFTLDLTSLFLPASLLFIVSLLSLINAKSIGTGLESIAILIYFFLIYLLIVNTVKTKGHIKLLVGVILVSAVLASLYGLLQYYGVLPGAPGRTGGSGAIISSLGNKNYLGGFIAYLFVPSLILIFVSKKLWIKILGLVSSAIIYLTLIPVSSDGAWGALIAAALFLLIGMAFFRLFSLFSKNRLWVILLVSVLVLIYLLQGAPGPLNSLLGYSATTSSQEKGWISSIPVVGRLAGKLRGVRAEDWWVGWEMFKDHPILGVGIGNYKVRFLEYKGIFRTTERSERFDFYIKRAAQAHNEYVQMGSELGLLGILALAFVAFTIFRAGIRRILWERSPESRFMLLAFLAGVVAFMVHSTVSFPLHLPASALDLILFAGLINCGYFENSSKENRAKKEFASWFKRPVLKLNGPILWVVASLVLILAISVSVLAYRDWRADIHLDKGIRELQMGREYTAREEFNRSLRLSFHPRQVLFYLGVVNQQLGQTEKAEDYFKKSLNTYVVESAYLQLASINFQKGDYSESLLYLDQLLAIDPTDSHQTQARFMIALIDIKQGKASEALSKLNELIKKQPNFERAYMARAEIYKGQGRFSQAKEDLELALEIIERKLTRNRRKLETRTTLSRDEYAQIRSEIETLENEKKSVEESLKQFGVD